MKYFWKGLRLELNLLNPQPSLEGKVHRKIKILSSFMHPHVDLNMSDFLSTVEQIF